jgi:RES domain-containing protein
MHVYRLTRRRHLNEFSGKGAALFGARWNSKGTEVIYAAESRALAMAEVAVHLSLDNLPADFVMLTIDIPDEVSIAPTITPEELESNWNIFPHSTSTQITGDNFVRENRHCVLRVPSAVVKGDYNIIINPNHPDFSLVRIIGEDDFPFDRRFIYH